MNPPASICSLTRSANPTLLATLKMAFCDNHRQLRLPLARLIYSIAAYVLIAAPVISGELNNDDQSDQPVSFVNDIMPVLTKAGCNSGVCHAKAGGGQNGFELSLLGFEPAEDYGHLTREGRGRRLFPAAPDRSLLLQKISGGMPHGGGIRLQPESEGYQLIRKWIEQSTPDTAATDPVLESVEVQPPDGVLEMLGQQQLKALASLFGWQRARCDRARPV